MMECFDLSSRCPGFNTPRFQLSHLPSFETKETGFLKTDLDKLNHIQLFKNIQ